MKLRNKKTGEIIDIYKGEITLHYNQGRKTIHFKRLEDLEEWEDYEEPKDFWYIDDFMIMCGTEDEYTISDLASFTKKDIEKLKAIGNYFETKEEAEKAVEKLKAWKQLKDKGFEFCKYSALAFGEIDFRIPDFESWNDNDEEQVKKDLDLLFGGEE